MRHVGMNSNSYGVSLKVAKIRIIRKVRGGAGVYEKVKKYPRLQSACNL